MISQKLMQVGGSDKYWISTFTSPGQQMIATGVAFDNASGDVFACGSVSRPDNTNELFVTRLSRTGAVKWQKVISEPSYRPYISIDSQRNIIVSNGFYLFKLSRDGVILWQRLLSSTAGTVAGRKIAVDSNDNIFICGHHVYKPYVAKFDTNGNLVSSVSKDGYEYFGVAVDSNDNVVLCGSEYDGSEDNWIVHKLTNSFTTIFAVKHYSLTIADNVAYSAACDSSDNVITAGMLEGFSTQPDTGVSKVDSSGNLLWVEKFDLSGAASNRGSTNAVAVDASDNIYVTGKRFDYSGGGVPTYSAGAYIYKIDSNKLPVFGHRIYGPAYAFSRESGAGYDIFPIKKGFLFAGEVASGDDLVFIVAKLPDDGSGTGTYGDIIYEADTLYEKNGAPAFDDYFLLSNSHSMTVSTPTETISDASYSQDVYKVRR